MHNLICNTALVLWCISIVLMLIDVITNLVVQPPILNIIGIAFIVLGMACVPAIAYSKR